MKRFLLAVVLFAGLTACDEAGLVKNELDSAKSRLDTLVDKVETAPVVDSMKSKGGRVLDSVKSKGGRLVEKAERRFNRKDTTP